jgi:pyridoxal 5'-phosphate synthase pdxS subunit
MTAMADETTPVAARRGTVPVKRGLAEMLKGGVIMDVVTAEHPEMIEGIKAAVTIPVMAKARIGHFVEAQILEALGVDYVDESEVLSPADEAHHIDKWAFTVPFVCGATNLGEALRRISEGACMIRSKGEAGTGNIVEAVRHLRSITSDMRKITQADPAELFDWAKRLQAPLPLVQEIADTGWLPVPLFCAGGIATPADAALAMQLGAEAVFVGSGIFKSADPAPRAKAIVEATAHFRDAEILAKVSRGLGTPMTGIGMDELDLRLADRGW